MGRDVRGCARSCCLPSLTLQEFVPELRHDRSFTLSMANAGPRTNDTSWRSVARLTSPRSQFFISTLASLSAWSDIAQLRSRVPGSTTNTRSSKVSCARLTPAASLAALSLATTSSPRLRCARGSVRGR